VAFEAGNAVRHDDAGKGRVLRLDAARLGGMLERGAAFGAAVAWHPAAALIAFVPRLVMAARRPAGERAGLTIEAAAGLALCAIAYATVAAVTYLTRGAYPLGAPLTILFGPSF
jgi:hypothetical protein